MYCTNKSAKIVSGVMLAVLGFVLFISLAFPVVVWEWSFYSRYSGYEYETVTEVGFQYLFFISEIITEDYIFGLILIGLACWFMLFVAIMSIVMGLRSVFSKNEDVMDAWGKKLRNMAIVAVILYFFCGVITASITSSNTEDECMTYTFLSLIFALPLIIVFSKFNSKRVAAYSLEPVGAPAAYASTPVAYASTPATHTATPVAPAQPAASTPSRLVKPTATEEHFNEPASSTPSRLVKPTAQPASSTPSRLVKPTATEEHFNEPAAAVAPDADAPIYELNGGATKILRVYEDRVTLEALKNMRSFMTSNYFGGTKEIFYEDMIGVQFKEATGIVLGYMQFETANTHAGDNFNSENSFTFDRMTLSNEKAKEVLDFVREKVRRAREKRNGGTTVVAAVSAADELIKWKGLLDQGIISQEEFDAKKKQLLGL